MSESLAHPKTSRFAGSVTVITGAGSGIGRALALSFARRGALVVSTDLDAEAAARTRELVVGAGGNGWDMALDVTSTADHAAVRDLCLDRWGRVDRVVNNAGMVTLGLPQNIPLDAWHHAIDVNLLGLVRSNEIFLPVLLEQGFGQLVNTASTSGLFPYSFDRTPYVATKAAVVALTESLALYLRPQGIDVSCVAPAGVRTGMRERMVAYGELPPMGTPDLPVVLPDDFAEHVADELEAGTFLICSTPEAYEAVARRGADIDANLGEAARRYGFGASRTVTT